MPERDENGQFSGGLYIREKGTWNLRYFILDEGLCLLRYFDRNKSSNIVWDNCEGEINIRFITKIEDKFKTEESIEIQTWETKYYLRADNRSDLDDWVKLLRKAAVDPSKRQGSLKRTTPPTSSGEAMAQDESTNTSEKQKPEEAICYQTKIIGGVVVKTPVRKVSDVDGDDEARQRTASGGGPVTAMKPIKEGFLVKKGAVVKNWKRRYFKLDSVKLSYFEKDTDRDPLKTISTAEIHQVRPHQSFDGTSERIFEVVTQNRIYLIQAETAEEMEAWMSAIKRVTNSRDRAVTDPETVGRHKGHGNSQSYKLTTAI